MSSNGGRTAEIGSRARRYGVVNAVLGIPSLYGYAAVIFSNAAFAPVAGALSKAVVLSSAVHQAVFTCRSTLPFARRPRGRGLSDRGDAAAAPRSLAAAPRPPRPIARGAKGPFLRQAIGQVQDAGLIFLSKMATIVATRLGDDAATADVAATALAGLCGGTCLLGFVLVGVGRARLTWLVSSFRRADTSPTNRGDAAAGTRIFGGDERRRGRDVDIWWRRVTGRGRFGRDPRRYLPLPVLGGYLA